YSLLELCCDPRLLHSFPTRRSSDLLDELAQPRARALAGHCVVLDLLVADPEHGHRDLCQLGVVEQDEGPVAAHLVRVVAVLAPGDRKSTRLNSSHVKISYAVFCLKK